MSLFRHSSHGISPALAGVMQALGVLLYILLFVWVVSSVLFDRQLPEPGPFLGMGLVLLLFSFSALVCGSITLAYPAVLVSQKRWQDALRVLAWMIGSMALLVAVALAYMAL